MYTLYYLPGACSLATQVLLRELGQEVNLVHRDGVDNYAAINTTGSVPVLRDGDRILREGAGIALYLLDKHANGMLPAEGPDRIRAIEHILFANATVHPAYSKLFFLNGALEDGEAKNRAMTKAAGGITKLWGIVEDRLGDQPFLGGAQISAADIMLTVYAAWGDYFPFEIQWGPKVAALLARVRQRPAFQASLEAEKVAGEKLATA